MERKSRVEKLTTTKSRSNSVLYTNFQTDDNDDLEQLLLFGADCGASLDKSKQNGKLLLILLANLYSHSSSPRYSNSKFNVTQEHQLKQQQQQKETIRAQVAFWRWLVGLLLPVTTLSLLKNTINEQN